MKGGDPVTLEVRETIHGPILDSVETADLVILRAMDAAGADLRDAFGPPDRWSWGRLHTATFAESTIGTGSGVGPLEWYLPSYRLLDMTDLDGARIVLMSGQSGDPFDRHYNDNINRWRLGETLSFPFTATAVEAATAGLPRLVP